MRVTEDRLDHLDDSRCADLVLNLVPAAEREAALSHAASCPGCEARLRSHVAASFRARGDWRTWVLAASSAAMPVEARVTREAGTPAPTGRVTPLAPPTRGWVPTMAAAAVFVVAIAWPLLQLTPGRQAAPWLPPSGEPIHAREGAAEDPHIGAGLTAYDARDLATADLELSAARASGSTEELRRLYLGHVRLERGDAPGSVALLRTLNWGAIPEPWRRDGVRVLAHAMRVNGETAAADSIERALRALDPAMPYVP